MDEKVSLNSIRARFMEEKNMELACDLTLTVTVSMIHPENAEGNIDASKVVGAIHVLEDDDTGAVGGMADITLSDDVDGKSSVDYSLDEIAGIFGIKPDDAIWEVGDAG